MLLPAARLIVSRSDKGSGRSILGLQKQDPRRLSEIPRGFRNASEIQAICNHDKLDLRIIQACHIIDGMNLAHRPYAERRDGGKQVAGLFDRGPAAGKGRWPLPTARGE